MRKISLIFQWIVSASGIAFQKSGANRNSYGADLIGYFVPHEGSTSTTNGIHSLQSLEDYRAYRTFALFCHDIVWRNSYKSQPEPVFTTHLLSHDIDYACFNLARRLP